MPDAGKITVSGIEIREVVVQSLPAPDRLVMDWDHAPVCYITDDGTSLCSTLAENLIDRGWKVVVLQWVDPVDQTSTGRLKETYIVPMQGCTEADIQTALREASQSYGPASALICLEPVSPGSDQEQGLQAAFWLAKYLQPVLTETSHGGRNAFLTVTRMDGVLGTSGEGSWSAISGGLFGLVKTLNLEWENVFCRALDIQPDLSVEKAVEVILIEMEDPDRTIVEVGVGQQDRVTLALAPAARSTL